MQGATGNRAAPGAARSVNRGPGLIAHRPSPRPRTGPVTPAKRPARTLPPAPAGAWIAAPPDPWSRSPRSPPLP